MTSKLDEALAMLRNVVTSLGTPADRAKARRVLDATFNTYGCQPGDLHDFGKGRVQMLARDLVRGSLAWVMPDSPKARAYRAARQRTNP